MTTTENPTGYPDEGILPDDYPVYAGYFYVADFLVCSSGKDGKVSDLKKWLSAKEIRRCNIIARMRSRKEVV